MQKLYEAMTNELPTLIQYEIKKLLAIVEVMRAREPGRCFELYFMKIIDIRLRKYFV